MPKRRRSNPRARRKNPLPEELRRGVRLERCDRCWRQCRRAESVRCPLSYEDVKFGFKQQVKDGTRTSTQAWITPHTILGRMHELKEEEWQRFMDECPNQGEQLPTTIEHLFEWANKLSAVDVRLALGADEEKARRMKAALKVKELKAYYEHMLDTLPAEEEPPFIEDDPLYQADRAYLEHLEREAEKAAAKLTFPDEYGSQT